MKANNEERLKFVALSRQKFWIADNHNGQLFGPVNWLDLSPKTHAKIWQKLKNSSLGSGIILKYDNGKLVDIISF